MFMMFQFVGFTMSGAILPSDLLVSFSLNQIERKLRYSDSVHTMYVLEHSPLIFIFIDQSTISKAIEEINFLSNISNC